MSDTQTKLGQIIEGDQMRDAIHIAVAPVTAAMDLKSGQHVGFLEGQTVGGPCKKPIGIVDPFLPRGVQRGERFWLFLYPNTITSLKHVWTHPAFIDDPQNNSAKSASESWMRAWAMEHMSADYYGDDGKLSPEVAYANAIDAGHNHRVGPYEEAREHIDNEWWYHWEAITGERGDRDTYFSCAC